MKEAGYKQHRIMNNPMLNLKKKVECKSCISRRIKITAGNKATTRSFYYTTTSLLNRIFQLVLVLPAGIAPSLNYGIGLKVARINSFKFSFPCYKNSSNVEKN